MRVGIGYDIHRTDPERQLVLAGVVIPPGPGLDGHSDADVITHAIMDALLGAAGLGDIGHHFPPSDRQYRDASSLQLLKHVVKLLDADGWTVSNVDVVVVAERPILAPYVADMRRLLGEALTIDVSAVSVKATTNEGVGPEGRGEAMSAHAVALLVPQP